MLMMIVIKYLQFRNRDFKKAESFIFKPQKYSQCLVLNQCQVTLFNSKIFNSSSCSPLTSFVWTTFLKIENDCNFSSSIVKNLFQIFGLRKEIEYFVDIREIAIRLKQFSENFVRYLRNGFLIISLNVNGSLYLLLLYLKTRCWQRFI